jgi:hypothetical protein
VWHHLDGHRHLFRVLGLHLCQDGLDVVLVVVALGLGLRRAARRGE